MGKVSKRRLDKSLEEHITNLFWKNIAELKTPESVELFFKDLLSPVEQLMLVKRLAIAVLLAKGYTYDRIDDTLKVSRQTIMQVSYWLKHGGQGYQKIVEKIISNQKKDSILDAIEETLLKLSRTGMVGTKRFEKRQKTGKELFRRKQLRNQF